MAPYKNQLLLPSFTWSQFERRCSFYSCIARYYTKINEFKDREVHKLFWRKTTISRERAVIGRRSACAVERPHHRAGSPRSVRQSLSWDACVSCAGYAHVVVIGGSRVCTVYCVHAWINMLCRRKHHASMLLLPLLYFLQVCTAAPATSSPHLPITLFTTPITSLC
jgi:hypothetical protein